MKNDILLKELNNLIHLVNRWDCQGYIPQIEKDIALKRVQSLYGSLLGLETVEESDFSPVISTFSPKEVASDPVEGEGQECIDESEVTESAEAVESTEIVEGVESEEGAEAVVEEEEIEEEATVEIVAEEAVTEEAEPVVETQVEESVVAEQDSEQDSEQHIEQDIEQDSAESGDSEPTVEDEPVAESEPPVEALPEQPAPKAEAYNEAVTPIEQLMSESQKMRFTHDLFCNDYTIFKNELRKINKLESLDEVLIYIGEFYNWNSENQSALEFVEIVAAKLQNNQ